MRIKVCVIALLITSFSQQSSTLRIRAERTLRSLRSLHDLGNWEIELMWAFLGSHKGSPEFDGH